jgi:hypothetical protein
LLCLAAGAGRRPVEHLEGQDSNEASVFPIDDRLHLSDHVMALKTLEVTTNIARFDLESVAVRRDDTNPMGEMHGIQGALLDSPLDSDAVSPSSHFSLLLG